MRKQESPVRLGKNEVAHEIRKLREELVSVLAGHINFKAHKDAIRKAALSWCWVCAA